ncbi:MAG: uroporphyrinogen decarboxylase [Gammaproteobacteria bacterium]|nr:MAG: uroporphyrinogen decarboxylase [Gammaproteobacteria bacterium]
MFQEIIGYLASAFIVSSLLMGNMRRLRYVNMVGCVLFVIYGLILPAYPVAIMNAVAALINFIHLIKLSKKGKIKQ